MREQPAPQQRNKKIILGLIFSIFILGIASGFAQSLGEVAREERERKEENSRRPRVYTNEDLARPRIEGRESREEAAAAASASTVSGQTPAEQDASLPLPIIWPDNVPLGDIARFYRKQRELESVKELRFAIEAPPVLDLDFLLPTPLASPLPDFSPDFFANELLPPPSVPEPVWDHFAEAGNTVRVERGDTLWKIAARHLGDGRAWPRIAAANPELKDPNRIQAGQTLRLPGTGISSATGISSSEKRVRVQTGDSLWKLAASQLGSGHAWNCLAAANPQIENANRIYPGQLLVIPTNCSAGV